MTYVINNPEMFPFYSIMVRKKKSQNSYKWWDLIFQYTVVPRFIPPLPVISLPSRIAKKLFNRTPNPSR